MSSKRARWRARTQLVLVLAAVVSGVWLERQGWLRGVPGLVAEAPTALPPQLAPSALAVPDFTLLDHRGEAHQLYRLAPYQAVVIIAHGNGCPVEMQHLPKLRQLAAEHAGRVRFIFIDPNRQDTRKAVAESARAYGIELPILLDPAQDVSRSLGLTRTAEAVVISTTFWSTVYRGAIDDAQDYDGARARVGHDYLRDAIRAVLEGRPAPVSHTVAKGCVID